MDTETAAEREFYHRGKSDLHSVIHKAKGDCNVIAEGFE